MRIAINGFGRIGRNVFRILHERYKGRVEVVHINDLTDPATLAHLLKYDSVAGRFPGAVTSGPDWIAVDGKKITITALKDPAQLPHGANKVDFVVESTGVFTKKSDLEKHVQAGAKRVLLTVPPKDEIDNMIVLGVNDAALKSSDRIISNASCTTNCLAPVAKVLHESFGIVKGLMTTIHSYTNDQRVLDLPHEDYRRMRAAALNMIITKTGAAKALKEVLPAMAGKLDGFAIRVPTPNVSCVDLTVNVEKPVTKESVNDAFKKAAEGPLKGVLAVSNEPLVSSDYNGDTHSSTVDALSTMVQGDMVKVVAWYDNERGYSQRLYDLTKFVAAKL
jgi:glyceraldehyde 3-phosphate dehydrogenase